MSTEDVQFLRDYRSRLDGACEGLAMTLGEIGLDTAHDDEVLVELAGKKLKMFFEMLVAAGVNVDLLKATVRG